MAILTAVFLMPSAVWGENYVEIGTGGGNDNYVPFAIGANMYYSITQQLYLASELGNTEQSISGLSFYYNSTSGTYTRAIEIYIAETEITEFTNTGLRRMFSVNGSTNRTPGIKVFDGEITTPGLKSWYKIDFDNNFSWNGSSNIVITINDKTGSVSGRTYHKSFSTGTAIRTLYCQATYSGAASFTGNNTYGITSAIGYTSVAFTRFHFAQATSIATPENLASVDAELTDNTAKVEWDAVDGADSYTIRYKKNGAIEYSEVSGITDTHYAFTELEARTKYFVGVKAVKGEDASAYTSDITFTTHSEPLTINDLTADYSAYEGNSYYLTINRTLTSASYNTLCLPFGMKQAQCEALFGTAYYTILELKSSELVRNYLILNFEEKFSITAGKPYLVKPESDINSWVVEGATIATTTTPTETSVVNFIGVLTPTVVEASKANLFLGADNTLYYNESAGTLKGMRAYFQVVEPSAVGAPARIRTANETTTGIESTFDAERAQKLLNEGRVIIRIDGHDYDLNGTMIR